MPYFPYSRQSKKKSHRGAITARMIANLLHVAGVTHVITIDLHASQMQGFFKCPVDNLVAEPLLARWIRNNVPSWRDCVIVSKNAGGTKRVTSLADALKLSFGIVTTDRRRPGVSEGGLSMSGSAIFERMGMDGTYETHGLIEEDLDAQNNVGRQPEAKADEEEDLKERPRAISNAQANRIANGNAVNAVPSSPLVKSSRAESIVEADLPGSPRAHMLRTVTAPPVMEDTNDEYVDEVSHIALRIF